MAFTFVSLLEQYVHSTFLSEDRNQTYSQISSASALNIKGFLYPPDYSIYYIAFTVSITEYITIITASTAIKRVMKDIEIEYAGLVNLLVRKNVWVFVSHQTVQSCLLNLLILMTKELKRRSSGDACLLNNYWFKNK